MPARPALAAGMPGGTSGWEQLEERERGGRRQRRQGPQETPLPRATTHTASPTPTPEADFGAEDQGDVATARPPAWSVGGELDVNSRYLWRGIALSGGPVAQPTAYVDWRGLTGAVWLNLMLSKEGGAPLTTVLPSLSYLYERGDISLGAEAAWIWDIGDTAGNPTAVTLGAEASWSPGVLEISTGHYVNVATAPGAYWGEIGVGLAAEVDPWALVADVEVGVGSPRFRTLYLDHLPAALVVVTGSLRLAYAFGEHLSTALHAETYAVASPTASADVERLLANIGLTFAVDF